jgi:prophage regulatory protein
MVLEPAFDALPADAILRLPDVIRVTGLSRSSVYEKARRGQFPKSVRISERVIGWRIGEVRRWLREPLSWCELAQGIQP